MKTNTAASGLLFIALLPIMTGCTSLPTSQPKKPAPPESKQTFGERKQDAIASFERQRDAAQIQAAVNCWQRGEVQKSVAQLTAIIQRSPRDVNARLRLAEILTSQEETASAEMHLRECLVLAPNSAEAHHALGLLLSEVPSRETEAASLLRRAAELEPDNEVFAATASAL